MFFLACWNKMRSCYLPTSIFKWYTFIFSIPELQPKYSCIAVLHLKTQSVVLKSKNLLKNSGSTRYLEPIKPSHWGDGYPFKKRICPGERVFYIGEIHDNS